MGIESERVAKALDSNDRARHGFLFRHGLLRENFQGFPSAAAEIGMKVSIIEKIPAQYFGNAENKLRRNNL